MAVAEQFAGLNMGQLIGGPLTAVADASTLLANSTADFINRVGFDGKGNLRTVAFAYQKRSMNEDGTSNLDAMKVEVPMLAIVPIPNIQVDEVNILFDMEVKQSEKSQQSLDMGASLTGSLGIGPIKVSISGSVSAHKENTRSSDNSAKYHVDVRATNHGTPEGLARVLDMMAANVAPALVGSTLKGADGQTLSDSERTKAENLKKLRGEVSNIEARLNAAKSNLEDRLTIFKKCAATQQNLYSTKVAALAESATEENQQAYDSLMQSWNDFQNQVGDIVSVLADSAESTESASGVSALSQDFALMGLTGDNSVGAYDATSGAKYNAMVSAQNSAVVAQMKVNAVEQELYDKKEAYNTAMSK
ncbi:MAG: DUF2589 domain-containing protein [Butyrivibrio sp.]|nr:DUF2589 domain-containing protein [Muribaculum sp.]MCM1552719.1 DUF2589 domain-containing protein [Butyrivibrio sp.]